MSAFFTDIINFPNILVRQLCTSIPILWNWDMDRLGQMLIMKKGSPLFKELIACFYQSCQVNQTSAQWLSSLVWKICMQPQILNVIMNSAYTLPMHSMCFREFCVHCVEHLKVRWTGVKRQGDCNSSTMLQLPVYVLLLCLFKVLRSVGLWSVNMTDKQNRTEKSTRKELKTDRK